MTISVREEREEGERKHAPVGVLGDTVDGSRLRRERRQLPASQKAQQSSRTRMPAETSHCVQ